jgi:hypothetical protein
MVSYALSQSRVEPDSASAHDDQQSPVAMGQKGAITRRPGTARDLTIIG